MNDPIIHAKASKIVEAIRNKLHDYADYHPDGVLEYYTIETITEALASLETTDKKALPSIEEAGIMAVKISEKVEPKISAQEQSFFIAGFCECIKWLNNTHPSEREVLEGFAELMNKEFSECELNVCIHPSHIDRYLAEKQSKTEKK